MEKWKDPQTLAIWIGITLFVVFTIVIFIIKIMHTGYKRMVEANLREADMKLQHQRKLMETGLEAQEQERKRIAADLHDSLIGKLTVIRMKGQLGGGQPELDSLLAESITEARRISHDLTPPLLEQTAIAELLENIIDPWSGRYEVSYVKDVRTQAEISPVQKIQLIRIVQELVTNAVKHSGAGRFLLRLRVTGNSVSVIFADNGKGFNAAAVKKGLGLDSLEMRLQSLGGAYKTKSAPGRGTRTIITIPTHN